MEKLQLLLTGGKGSSTDLAVHLSADETSLFVYLGLALLERVGHDPDALMYKMLVGRLANSGVALRELERTFGHDHRTMKRWGDALKSADPQFVVRAFAGQGALPKVTEAIVAFVQLRYAELKGTVRNYRQRIAMEVRRCFGQTLSREILRRLFAAARDTEETSAPGAASPVPAPATAAEPALASPPTTAPTPTPAPEYSPATPAPAPPPVFGPEPDPAVAPCSELAVQGPVPGPPPDPQVVSQAAAPCESVVKFEPLAPAPVCINDSSARAAAYPSQSGPARENGCLSTPISSVAAGATDNHSPAPVRGGPPDLGGTWDRPRMPLSGQPVGVTPRAVHHAGQVLFAPWLDLLGFDRDAALARQTQWLGQVLQGAVNIEQSKGVCASDLALFVGPVVAGLDTQRRELHAAAGPEATLAVLRANARIVTEGPGVGQYFYYDTHSKEYTGDVPILKGWCGRRHATAKVLHLDLIHTRLGDPCFVQHFDNFYDLRERFFIALRRFDELFPGPLCQGRTFILDRGIYGLDTVRLFLERGDGLITWDKGYTGGDWLDALPALEFVRTRPRNRHNDLRAWKFRCQEGRWAVDPRVRRLLVRATNPAARSIEVAVLCTDTHTPAEQAVTLIFNRWIQENDFRYLDTHFGLMQVTAYGSVPYSQLQDDLHDRAVECPQYKETKRRTREAETDLAALLLRREKLTDARRACQREHDRLARQLQAADRPPPPATPGARHTAKTQSGLAQLARKISRTDAALAKLQPDIDRQKAQVETLHAKLRLALREQSRLQLLIAQNYRQLDTRAKELMDAIRLTARNVYYRLANIFRPLYDNYRDDHELLRGLTRASGLVRRRGDTVEVLLWPKARFEPAQRRVVETFLERITNGINSHFRARASPVRIRLLDAHEPL